MSKRSYRSKRGMPPGSLIFTGEQKMSSMKITSFDYDEKTFYEREIKTVDELRHFKENGRVSWINICGLHEVDKLSQIGEIFEIHPLILEDILNVNHLPKLEDYDKYLFLVTKMIDTNKESKELKIEQVSFILSGNNCLLTFQEDEGDVFNLIRERIRSDKGKIRQLGADYLMYRLLDAIVDNYFFVLMDMDEIIENLEDELIYQPVKSTIETIHDLRKKIIKIRRAVTPLRDIIYSIERDRYPYIAKSTYIFLRDLYDHIRQNIETMENYREMLNGMLEIYLSSSGQKLNEVVKVLTIISTIFIPLTFLAGIYGMNFNTSASKWNMPELTWQYGYPVVIIVMLVIAVGMIFFFKKKDWL
ncbi:MAG TPA: magnesium/cobalt transporter CorA [Ignavibacteriaceae bacterium]|nr:magnesium/cobalt transporter CorA [Ignavibacteriaceae bacterium]